MLNVKIDVSTLDSTSLTGIGNYIKYLTASLRKIPDLRLLGSYRLSRIRKQQKIRQHVPGLPLRVYVPLLNDLIPTGTQVFHGPDFRIPPGNTCRKVITIHDMGHLDGSTSFPEFRVAMAARMDKNVRKHKPDMIIAVSEFTKQQVLSVYPEFQNRIRRIYLGADHLTAPAGDTPAPFDFPYILFVGSLEKRKNLHGLLDAFERLDPALKDVRLVIAGGPGSSAAWTSEILRKIQSSKPKDRIRYLNYADSKLLKQLYTHASCFIYPSLYEGFGIPILEAMSNRCPVITSNCGAMREISGDAAFQVDPMNVDSITGGIQQVLNSAELRRELIRKGEGRYREFTWKQCAEETAQVYRELA